jgi:hypothetical protein
MLDDHITDKDLLERAEADLAEAINYSFGTESNTLSLRSLAASQLVIARNSVQVEVNQVIQKPPYERIYGSRPIMPEMED